MSKPKILQLENFILGMRRDGSLTQEAERDENLGANPYILHSLKTLENYDILYEDGGLSTRGGYERYNAIVLPDSPKQIFYHTNLPRTSEFLMGIVGERWYKIQEGISHEMVIDEATTLTDGFKKPIFSWNNRIFFATDIGWYWTDADRLYDGTKYYQAGIDKPSSNLIIRGTAPLGNYASFVDPNNFSGAGIYDLTDVSVQKISSEFTPSYNILVSSLDVRMSFYYNLTKSGNVQLRIETIDVEGNPSGILIDEYSLTDWIDVKTIYVDHPASRFGDYIWYRFNFKGSFTLEKDTTYAIVIESDDAYKENYSGNVTQFFVAFSYNAVTGGKFYCPSEFRDWHDSSQNIIYAFTGFDEAHYYEYCCTYYNSKYGIESRPSAYQRIQIQQQQAGQIDSPQPVDPQVDKIRIYRREFGEDQGIDVPDEEIIDTFKWVGDISASSIIIPEIFHDSSSTESLGAELQTFDHYRIGEADDTGQNLRGAIVPAGGCIWKGRVWVFPKNSNVLYFSKKLEEDGASGLTGDPIPDYFTLENKLELQEESSLLAVRPLANDQLAIYFRNGTIYTLWGMDEVLNPPSDYSERPQVYGLGLISSWGLTDYKSRHVYISRHGLYAFSGAPDPEYLSESIQSIIDGISDANLAKAVVIARGEEIWLLVDENNDGINDTIYILNLQKTVKPWRRYTYNTNINDLLVKSLSTSSKDIIAADNTNKYLLELNTGTTDGGKPIESFLETHRQKVGDVFIHEIEVKDRYDEDDMPASYDFLITDQAGNGVSRGINPSGSNDIRGHKAGTRIRAYGSFNVKMSQISVQQTDLLGIYIRYNVD